MSHFTVLVVGEDPETQLDPFNEELQVEKYTAETREELIENQKRQINLMRDNSYAEYLANSTAYLEKNKFNQNHCNYFVNGEFAEALSWSDEQLYLDATKYLELHELDGNGGRLSTYNPKSKWDWYEVGGRWDGYLETRNGEKVNQATIGEIDLATLEPVFAVLKGGEWHEKGAMGWWGMVADKKEGEDWNVEFKRLLEGLPDDTPLTLVDCHI